MSCSLRHWFNDLPWMQQGVLMSAFRNCDGVHQEGPHKIIVRGIRAACIKSARATGSFNARRPTPETLLKAGDEFINYSNELPVHFMTHIIHACEVLGYKHPDETISTTWLQIYYKLVTALHLNVETKAQFEKRLSDDDEQAEREIAHDYICYTTGNYGDNTGTANEVSRTL